MKSIAIVALHHMMCASGAIVPFCRGRLIFCSLVCLGFSTDRPIASNRLVKILPPTTLFQNLDFIQHARLGVSPMSNQLTFDFPLSARDHQWVFATAGLMFGWIFVVRMATNSIK